LIPRARDFNPESAVVSANELARRRAAERPAGIDLSGYITGRLLSGIARGNPSGYEIEVSAELARATPPSRGNILIPPQLFTTPQAVLSRGGLGSGAELATFERGLHRDALLPQACVIALGATESDGPMAVKVSRGPAPTFEYQTSETPAEGEGVVEEAVGTASEAPEAKLAIGSVTFSRAIGATTQVAGLAERAIHQAVADLIDRTALLGDGLTEPLGLFNRGVSSPGGDIAEVDASGGLTWADLTEIEGMAAERAGPSGWIAPVVTRTALRQLAELSGGTAVPAWSGGQPGALLGRPAFASSHTPHTGMAYSSDWSNLVIGLHSVELLVDPYTQANRSNVTVRMFVLLSIALAHRTPFVLVTNLPGGES
jgi:hypothetical protein